MDKTKQWCTFSTYFAFNKVTDEQTVRYKTETLGSVSLSMDVLINKAFIFNVVLVDSFSWTLAVIPCFRFLFGFFFQRWLTHFCGCLSLLPDFVHIIIYICVILSHKMGVKLPGAYTSYRHKMSVIHSTWLISTDQTFLYLWKYKVLFQYQIRCHFV